MHPRSPRRRYDKNDLPLTPHTLIFAGSPSPAPPWLQARGQASWLFPVRRGAGYAMGGTRPGVEVLTKSGKSCGCIAVPGLSPAATIGRDGSLIVPRTDHYELYPSLFH